MGLKVYADDIACRYEAPELETLLFPRMAVDQLVSDLAAQSGLGVSWDKFLVVASHIKLAKQAFRAVLDRSWCEGVSRGSVAGRGLERWAAWIQSQAEGQAQAVHASCKKVETPA